MPAYAYSIKINRNRERIYFDETVRIESDSLALADLAFVGDDFFTICEGEAETGIGCFASGYVIRVSRSRMETDDEMNTRISRGESYMAEYNRRKALKKV
jgi:hypothetical protein